jgi:hypothetical protein
VVLMPALPKPTFAYDYSVEAEVRALRAHKRRRRVPRRGAGRLLVATWNMANLGLQQRRDPDRRILAEVIGWFDLVAVQEVRDNFAEHRRTRRPDRPAALESGQLSAAQLGDR